MRMPLSSPLSFAIVPFNGSPSTAREPRSIVKSFEHETNVFVTSKYHLEEMGRSGGKGKGARKRERLEDKERTGEKSLVPGMDVSVKERGRSIKSSETRRIKGRVTVCSEGWSIGGGGWFHRKVWMETTWNRITAMILDEVANNRGLEEKEIRHMLDPFQQGDEWQSYIYPRFSQVVHFPRVSFETWRNLGNSQAVTQGGEF